MLRSLRSTLVVASLLWTAGLLMLMHLASMALLHVLPSRSSAHSPGMIAFGIGVMVAGVLVAQRALRPFKHLRQRLVSVRRGEERRVDGAYPSEVQPLIDDLNALLEAREQAVKRALATAGDLAHGLKTPLALLAQESDPASILQQVERMSRQVNYHLARARAAASGRAGAAPCPIADCADALVRTVSKLYASRALDISSQVNPQVCARVQREDLDEVLGNLLDNACKWARSRVVLDASLANTMVVLTVDDDGPGLAPALRSVVLERGVRADEVAPGSGLGLAIVRDLSDLYGGTLTLDDSPLGGLRARVLLPTS
jgi:signal transduction histidine kinase